MSIRNIELKPYELQSYYKKLIFGEVSVNDLADTQKAQLLNYATKQQNKALSFINEMIIANPGTTFEYWSQRLENYINANKVIESLKTKAAINTQPDYNDSIPSKKYTTKQHLLAYLIELSANGESYPVGQKRILERIGSERIGVGKGNTFYKAFNEVVRFDLNSEINLIEIGGENWRSIVIELSKTPKIVDKYLKDKQL